MITKISPRRHAIRVAPGLINQQQPQEQPTTGRILTPSNLILEADALESRQSRLRGATIGCTLAAATEATGVDHYLHEQGHMLVSRLFYTYQETESAPIQIDHFDQIRQEGLWSTLVAPKDINQDGAAGVAKIMLGKTGQTPLGASVGDQGAKVATSFAGSIADLAIGGLAVGAGIRQYEKNPALGAGLMVYGAMHHARVLQYAVMIGMKTDLELELVAKSGHDFANIAVAGRELTGISASVLANLMAMAAILYLPAIALITIATQKRQRVSNEAILQRWLGLADDGPEQTERWCLMDQQLHDYPRYEKFLAVSRRYASQAAIDPESRMVRTRWLRAQSNLELTRLQRYMVSTLSKKDRKTLEKSVLLDQAKQAGGSSRIGSERILNKMDKGLGHARTVGLVATGLMGFLDILARAFFPVLGWCATLFLVAIPILSLVSFGQSLISTIRACQSSLTKEVKVLHILGSVCAGFTVAALSLSILITGGFLIGAAVGLGLGLIRLACHLVAKKITPPTAEEIEAKNKVHLKYARSVKLDQGDQKWRRIAIGSGICATVLAAISIIPGAIVFTLPTAALLIMASAFSKYMQNKVDEITDVENADYNIRYHQRSASQPAWRRPNARNY